MTVLRAGDHKRMPWKNGGGVTTEIAVSPADAGLETFDWRVSMATVAADGPFSLFAGVDRTLAVLEGQGLILTVAEQPAVTLMSDRAPLAFPADAKTAAQLVSGPILDLNIMTRRGRFKHFATRVTETTRVANGDGATRLILCTAGTVVIETTTSTHTLAHYDAWLTRDACLIALKPGATAFLVTLTPE